MRDSAPALLAANFGTIAALQRPVAAGPCLAIPMALGDRAGYAKHSDSVPLAITQRSIAAARYAKAIDWIGGFS